MKNALASCNWIKALAVVGFGAVSTTAFSATIPNWGVDTKVRFFNDDRPVDGNLTEVIFVLENGRYTATQRIVHGGRRPQPLPADTITQIGSRLTCENQFADEIGTLTGVYCEYDATPVDGPRTQILAVLEDDSSGYEMTSVVTPSDFGGVSEPVTTKLGFDMKIEVLGQGIPSRLHCVDTATFADAPGFQTKIEMSADRKTTQVTRRPVRLRGQPQEPSVLDDNSYNVQPIVTRTGAFSLSIVEDVDTTVDWSTAESCYKFFPSDSFYVTKDSNGWSGVSRSYPIVKIDPSVENCPVPRLQVLPPTKILCSESNR